MSKRYPGGIIRKTPQTPSQTSAQGIWDMASVTQAVKENTWPIAGVPDPISKSLRFRSSASAYLNRTFSTPTNNKKWTWSGWIKRGTLSTASIGFFGQYTDASNRADFYFDASDNLNFYNLVAGSVAPTPQWITSQVFRDPSAWYHIIIVWDSNNATAGDRIIIYVNGSRVTAYSSQGTVTSGQASQINSAAGHNLGRFQNASTYFDGYLAEVYFIDGQALTPSSFGNTNDQTGVWQPIAYTGTYGTNGFYLPFSNTTSTTTLGNDFSGNSNNWTPNNISLTSGSTYDSMVDVPTQWIPYNTAGDTGALFRGNYWTLNPLNPGQLGTPQSGNLEWIAGDQNNFRTIAAPILPSSGKFYWEVQPIGGGAGGAFVSGIYIGIMNYANGGTGLFASGVRIADTGRDDYAYYNDGRKVNSNSFVSYGTSYVANDIIGIAVDIDNGKIWFSKNGTWQASGDPAAGTNAAYTTVPFSTKPYAPAMSAAEITNPQKYNFGQRPFSYTPPAGFKTLCTTNLSTPTIGATASTQANDYFDATLYTGNGSTQSITNSGSMQPDWVWIKARSAIKSHCITDAVRGTNLQLASNSTAGDQSTTDGITAFNSNGFSLGAGVQQYSSNDNGTTYVAWQWKANGSGSTNTAGSITSTVSVDTTAGFSIVTYTGNGTIGATIGHGLGVAPSVLIVKQRTGGLESWQVYHSFLGATQYLQLNSSGAAASNINRWNNTAPTSTVFTVYNDTINNGNTNTYVAYCFAQIANYSAFGGYTGNGSTDGPFIYTGFRPAFVIVKRSSAVTAWYMFDKARNPYNFVQNRIEANTSDAEASGLPTFDFLSNGFKLRDSDAAWNGSGSTYVYMAFAESPFKYALAR